MTRMKKILLAGSMALVTGCVSLNTSIINISTLFANVKASAASETEEQSFNNSLADSVTTTTNGKVISVSNIPSSIQKGSDPASNRIPKSVIVSTLDSTGKVSGAELATATGGSDATTKVIIKNPYGKALLKADGTPVVYVDEDGEETSGGVSPAPGSVEKKELDDKGTYFEFNPAQIGTYTVQYAVQDTTSGVWTVSDVYNIEVTAERFDIQFAANNPIVMPSTVDTNQDTTIDIALPLFYNGSGKLIKNFVLEQQGDDSTGFVYVAEYNTLENVYFDKYNNPHTLTDEQMEAIKTDPKSNLDVVGKNIYEKYSTYQIKKIAKSSFTPGATPEDDYYYSVGISAKVSGSAAISNYAASIEERKNLTFTGATMVADEAYSYKEFAYSFKAGNGLNSIDYKLYETNKPSSSSVTMPLSHLSTSINGSVTYKKGDINLGVSVSSNIRSTATSLGEKIYLPEVSAVDKNANKNSVPAYYYYKVAYVDETKKELVYSDPSKVVMGIDEGGVYFIATSKERAKYNIYYNAQDFYYNADASDKDNKGHTDALADDYDYDVDVRDRKAASMYLVDAYDADNLTDAIKDDMKRNDLSYIIPTKYKISKTEGSYTQIVIPAVYAEDNLMNLENIDVTRTITSTDGFKYNGNTLSNFRITIQDGDNSTTETKFSDKDAVSKISIDSIVKFDNMETRLKALNLAEIEALEITISDTATEAEKFEALKTHYANGERYYYSQGKVYDRKGAVNAYDSEISNRKLKIFDDATAPGGKRLGVFKLEDSVEVEDTDAFVPGEFYLDVTTGSDPVIKKAKDPDKALVKKLKKSDTVTLTIDPNLFTAGEYKIEFRVDDQTATNDSGDTFTFTLVDATADVDTKAPDVKFTTATTLGNVGSDEVISVAKPRVSDDADTRILTKYYVRVGNEYFADVIEETSDNKLTFKTSDVVTSKSGEKSIYELAVASADKAFTIVALAYDDFASYDSNGQPTKVPSDASFALTEAYLKEADNVVHTGYAEYTISIKYIEDTLPPIVYKRTFVGDVETREVTFKQGEKVLVGGIEYYDNTGNAQIRNIKVVDSNGNICASQSLCLADFADYIKTEGAKSGNTEASVEKAVKQALMTTVTSATLPAISGSASIDNTQYTYKYTFPGISFVATEADNYTITYEICDAGTNNVTTYSFVTTKAVDTKAPVISGVSSATATLELGETYYISNVKAKDNKTAEADIDFTWEVEGAKVGYKNHWLTKNGNGSFVFNPQEVDVYTITLTAVDEQYNTSSKSFTVTVKDSKKPIVVLNTQYPEAKYGEYFGSKVIVDEKEGEGQDGIKWSDNKLPSVNLPGFKATDTYQEKGYSSLGANGTLTITAPNDITYVIDQKGNVTGGQNEIKLKMVSKNGVNYFTFTPVKRGHYTATYSATDLNNNKCEKDEVIDVYIGDTEVPAIYLTKAFKDKLDKGFVVGENNMLTINPKARILGDANATTAADLYVDDNRGKDGFSKREEGTGANKYDYVNVSISITNANNSTIKAEASQDDGLTRYKFDTAGTYTITFTVTDECGNTGTFNRSFVVTKNKASSVDATKIVGIVLIVVSVLILVGVVIYFVKGTKFLPKKKKYSTGKKEKSDSVATKEE